jgi:hypothetical protein
MYSGDFASQSLETESSHDRDDELDPPTTNLPSTSSLPLFSELLATSQISRDRQKLDGPSFSSGSTAPARSAVAAPPREAARCAPSQSMFDRLLPWWLDPRWWLQLVWTPSGGTLHAWQTARRKKATP